MRLAQAEIIQSPDTRGWVRLAGEVTYDDRPADPELYWFEVPDKWSGFLSETGNPWLACLLPVAVRLGEPLRIDMPVDRTLFENVQQLMRLWKGWYPHLHVIPIEAEVVETGPRREAARTVLFFSGGIDSFYTLLHHEAAPDPRFHIDDLMAIWGFDLPFDNQTAVQNVQRSLQSAASDLGKEFVEIATNLRATRFWQDSYKGIQDLSHGASLVSATLALERRYGRVLISSTYTPDDLHPWGSHPLTDPLLSSGQTQVVHYAAEVSRLEKVALVAQSDVALRTLRVCWYSETGGNCGRCDKCHHTMLMLELHGALDRCSTFEGKTLDLERIANKRDLFESERYFYEEIAAYAREQGRTDIADAVEHRLRLTRATTWVQTLHRVRQRLENNSALWGLLRPVRRVLRGLAEKVFGPIFGGSR